LASGGTYRSSHSPAKTLSRHVARLLNAHSHLIFDDEPATDLHGTVAGRLEDAQTIIAAIKDTPPDRPIDLILHTPGGLVLAAMQIARAVEASSR
jgi:ClpP class serine protease